MNVSSLGQRYLAGELKQHQLTGEVGLSRREDAAGPEQFEGQQRAHLCRLALDALAGGKVVLGVLAAGASSRMDLKQLPPEVARMLAECGQTDLPSSKALVPVVQGPAAPLNYLDLFLINVRRFSEQTGTQPRVLIFVSESNRAEITAHLERVAYQSLDPQRLLLFTQPLAPQIVATEDDARRAAKNFAGADMQQIFEHSRQYAGQDLPQKKPAGHGEFLHQLVASGMLSELHTRGVKVLSVRNIDNVAAVFDDTWLLSLGYLIEADAQMLVEVSQRPVGQKGGALVRYQNAWRLAEDPSFRGTGLRATDSYYINNAVALLRLDYLDAIYGTSRDELQRIESLPPAERELQRAAIAQRGRVKFPTIVEAKPVHANGHIVAAVTPETNMWEATGVIPDLRMLPFAVHSDRDAGQDLAGRADEDQRRRAEQVRFCPTKSWTDYADPDKKCIVQHIARRILQGDLVRGAGD